MGEEGRWDTSEYLFMEGEIERIQCPLLRDGSSADLPIT